MHLIESYATTCGLQIDKPFVYEKFFPLGFEKYITLSASHEQAKFYDYWNDVIDIISPTLKSKNIEIVQLGNKECKAIPKCASANGLTNRNQEAYIIRNSLLHMGVDDYLSQLAGFYDKKTVCIYSNNYPSDIKPYWGSSSNQILMESHRDEKKPSFSAVENPKTINLINPEDIAKNVLELLSFEFSYPFKTLSSGGNYFNKIIETIPNQVVDVKSMGVSTIIYRMDFEFNEENLAQQLSLCKCSIVTNKPISEELIKKYKPQINEIVYFIDENHDPSFASVLQKNGIKYALMTLLPEEDVRKYKIHYIDYGIIFPRTLPDIEKYKGKSNLFYKSSKLTLSNGKMFISKSAMLKDQPVKDQNDIQNVFDEEEFWDEADYFCILEKTS